MVSSECVSLTGSLYSEIYDKIVTWQIAPNEMIVEAQLAEEYNVSKTLVREALALLSQEGLVEVLPRVGYRVTSVGIGDIHEISVSFWSQRQQRLRQSVRRRKRC